MDNSAVQSQGSMSSISTSVQALDSHAGASSTNPSSEFVNHGLLLWNQTRQRWIGNKKSANPGPQESKLSNPRKRNGNDGSTSGALSMNCWDATYESLLGSNKPFPQPIPLCEMVDFLVDIWEQEGMYE